MNDVAKRTEGRVKITMYAGGALGTPPAHYDMAVKGIADITYVTQGFSGGRFPRTSVIEVPLLASSSEIGSRVLWGLWEKGLLPEYGDVKVLSLWTLAPFIIFSTKPVHSLEDLKGMKVRASDTPHVEVIKALGGAPVPMPISELYPALERKVVDAACQPWSSVIQFRANEYCKYYVDIPFSPLSQALVMNLDSWKRLSAKDQKIVEEVTGKKFAEAAGKANDRVSAQGRKMTQDAGLEIWMPATAELARWHARMRPLQEKWIADMEAKKLPGKKLFDEASELAKKYR